MIEQEKMDLAQKVSGDEPILSIMPYLKKKAGIVTTGNEVASGRIQDAFGPVLRSKLDEYCVEVIGQKIVSDQQEDITAAIGQFIDEGAELILVSGGMSVDPDDRTPRAIRDTGADIISYGAPVLPGAMFLLSYLRQHERVIPIMGLPGCVMYAKRTVFDLVLPRILAGEILEKEDIALYGEGGLCLGCESCTFPHCGFGR